MVAKVAKMNRPQSINNSPLINQVHAPLFSSGTLLLFLGTDTCQSSPYGVVVDMDWNLLGRRRKKRMRDTGFEPVTFGKLMLKLNWNPTRYRCASPPLVMKGILLTHI